MLACVYVTLFLCKHVHMLVWDTLPYNICTIPFTLVPLPHFACLLPALPAASPLHACLPTPLLPASAHTPPATFYLPSCPLPACL